MERWVGKIAIVTGASAGIGEAIVKALVDHGVKVVGLARRLNKLEDLSTKLGRDKFYPIECDVMKEEDILKAFQWTEKELGGVDIMVNNAGIVIMGKVIEMPTEDLRKTIDTNLIAPAICSREAISSMKNRNVPGHVININSLAGHYAESIHVPLGMYAVSKYGLTALSTEIRHEVILSKLNVKVTSISPGIVKTDILRGITDLESRKGVPMLESKDIADAVIYALSTAQSTEIPEILIMPHHAVIGLPANSVMSE